MAAAAVPVSAPEWAPALPADGLGAAVSRALAAWRRRLANGSPRTLATYSREVRSFLDFIARARGPLPHGLLAATPADVTAFISLRPNLAASTRAVKVAVVRGLFGALVLEGLIGKNPAAEVKVRHAHSGRHHPAVPETQVANVLARLAHSYVLRDLRDRALLLVVLAVGARRFEVGALNIGSVERVEDGVADIVFTGKGQKVVRMRIRPVVLQAIDRWLAASGHATSPDAPLFVNLSRCPEKRGRRLSGEGIRWIIKRHFRRYSPHSLRARAVSDVWKNSGGNLHHAQSFARHSSPAVTERVYVQGRKLDLALAFVPDYGATPT